MVIPPGMKVDHTSTIGELTHWRRMYEEPFFNPGICITETHLTRTLAYTPGRSSRVTSCSFRLSPFPETSPIVRKHMVNLGNQIYHSMVASSSLGSPPTKQQEQLTGKGTMEDKKQPSSNEEDMQSETDDNFSNVSDSCFEYLHTTKKPITSKPLLRRPLGCATQSVSRSTVVIDEDTFDAWRTASYTTVCVDNPLDPQGFYKLHYPLLLQQVPRRGKRGDSDHDVYRPLPKTPDISLSFLDSNSPDYLENISRESLASTAVSESNVTAEPLSAEE